MKRRKKKKISEIENSLARSKLLLKSKDYNTKIFIFYFFFIASFFLVYFVVDFIIQLDYLNNICSIYLHLKLISKRNPILKYNLLFSFE